MERKNEMHTLCDIAQFLEWDNISDSAKDIILRTHGFNIIGTLTCDDALKDSQKDYYRWQNNCVHIAFSPNFNVIVGEA